MSDTKNKPTPDDASILDYYRKLHNSTDPNEVTDAVVTLAKNYVNMKIDNTKGNDKYFHCKANCEATRRGELAKCTSTIMCDVREHLQSRFSKKEAADVAEDQIANSDGRNNAFKASDCRQACEKHRVKGINKRY